MANNFPPLAESDKPRFREWRDLMLAAIPSDDPLTLPSWPEFRDEQVTAEIHFCG